METNGSVGGGVWLKEDDSNYNDLVKNINALYKGRVSFSIILPLFWGVYLVKVQLFPSRLYRRYPRLPFRRIIFYVWEV